MWNSKLFNETCNKIVKEQGAFEGELVSSKEFLYVKIADALNVSNELVKKWTQSKSKGPREQDTLKKLEDLLGIELWDYSDCKIPYVKYSESCKRSIQKCYDILKDYLHSDEVENESNYAQMRLEIDKHKISIPDDIFKQIINFIDEKIEPIIYDYEKVFASLHTEEYGYTDDSGVFHVKGEKEFIQILGKRIQIIMDIEGQLDEFVMKVLSPILTE